MNRGISLVVVEGALEVPASLKLLRVLGISTEGIHPINKGGRLSFWRDAPKYSHAAAVLGPILGLTDLQGHPCPSGLIATHLKHGKHRDFVLRIAERMLESWLLADAATLAKYLRVSPSLFPVNPDAEVHPKRTLVNLARRCPSRSLKDDLVPEQGSSGVVGKGYVPRMTEFIDTAWQPLEAQHRSESLRRAVAAILNATQ
jgi:hypothetical protein